MSLTFLLKNESILFYNFHYFTMLHKCNRFSLQSSKNESISDKNCVVNFDVEEPFRVVEEDSVDIAWSTNVEGVRSVSVISEDEFVSVISGHEEVYHSPFSKAEEYQFVNASDAEMVTAEGLINMTAKFIGFNKIKVILYGDGKKILGNDTLLVGVTLKDQKMPAIFEKCLTALLVLLVHQHGSQYRSWMIVKKIVKQPIGPAIGLLSQYICMPLISFGLGLLAFPNEPLFRLGLFTSGCAPGGGLSNMWTHLLGGSLDLSIMMTFASTAFALD
ncbi:Solute carrier family 10 member 6 [Armadillidium vulgare]|nr:Solute carrier family 10 member 6 [Armadillidium vulgare]